MEEQAYKGLGVSRDSLKALGRIIAHDPYEKAKTAISSVCKRYNINTKSQKKIEKLYFQVSSQALKDMENFARNLSVKKHRKLGYYENGQLKPVSASCIMKVAKLLEDNIALLGPKLFNDFINGMSILCDAGRKAQSITLKRRVRFKLKWKKHPMWRDLAKRVFSEVDGNFDHARDTQKFIAELFSEATGLLFFNAEDIRARGAIRKHELTNR